VIKSRELYGSYPRSLLPEQRIWGFFALVVDIHSSDLNIFWVMLHVSVI